MSTAARPSDRMSANDLRTFWLLFGIYGPTMAMEDIRKQFFPSITLKTLANKATAGQLPKRAHWRCV